MSKTPFEIRTEVLQMTKEYLEAAYEANLEAAKKMQEMAKEAGEQMKDELPKYFTPEEWMALSTRFYKDFISSK